MKASRARLGPASYLAVLLWALVLVALLPGRKLVLVLGAIVIFGCLNGGAGLRALASPRFWLLLASIVAVTALILGERDLGWGPVRLSREGLAMGWGMAVRAAALVLAFNVTVGALSVSQVMRIFEALHVRGLGFALGVALNLGPVLRDVVEAAYHTIRLRGGIRRPWQSARLFLVTLIANALRYGDDVVKAAAARAFDPAAAPAGGAALLAQADRAFIALLAAAGLVLLVL